MNIKTWLSAHHLSFFIAFACLGVSLFVSRVEAQTWEFKLMLTKENLCSVNGQQAAGVPLSVSPGDEVIVQVRNNTSAKHLLRWRGVIYHGEPETATMQAISRRFYSLQKPVGAGETFTYRWKMENQGTLVHDCRVAIEQAI